MKKRIIGISIVIVILVLWVVRVVVVSNRYTLPEIREIKIGESFTAQGITYKYESMEMYDYEGIMEKYELNPEEMLFGDSLNFYEKKYYVMKYTITIEDDDYKYSNHNFGHINKYSTGFHQELPFIYALNGGSRVNMEKGESGPFYMVISLIDYDYTEETFDSLSVDDMTIYFYDQKTAIEYRMEAK